jgi:phosphatidylserine/phosphatidylglycerophosphate/cardiolipin synthase-like enzyme
MNNDGDYIWLEDGKGTVIDVVAFGKAYQGPGWTGPPGPAPRTGWAFVRDYRLVGTTRTFLDTNGSADWPVSRERRAEETWGPPLVEKASMELVAMRFPDDGDILAGVIKNTTSELLLNTYEFTSRSMGTVLEDLAKKGVKVKVLIEGHPVGGIQADEVQVLDRLSSVGCEVRLMGSNSSDYRPDPIGLDHAKYMVMDGTRTVVMSENLVASALGTSSGTARNRGWGLAVMDTGLAGHLKDVFMKDWPFGRELKDALPNPHGNVTDPGTERVLVPRAPAKATTFGGTMGLRSLETPDSTEDGLLAIINATQRRLYLELLSCDLDWHLQSGVTEKERSPLLRAVIDAARRGVDVKVLIDSNFLDTSDNDEVVSYLNEVANAEGLSLQARLAQIPYISLVHNKGMVADDTVLVSSINWVDSAVRDNREVGVAVELPALSELYTSYFMKDWEPQATPPGDGPGPVTGSPPTSVFTVCGAMLVIVAVALAALYMMKRGRW